MLDTLRKRRVYSLCPHMTANSGEEEDLTQEAYLRLFRKIGTFRSESAFSTWLHRIAVNWRADAFSEEEPAGAFGGDDRAR